MIELSKFSWRGAILLGAMGAVGALGATLAVVRAQTPSKAATATGDTQYSPLNTVVTEYYPRTPWGGYPYSSFLDAEIADPDVHRVLYSDGRTMLMEVTNPPGLDVHMHGHPYATVFVRDSGSTAGAPGADPAPLANNSNATGAGAGGLADPVLDPNSPFNGQGWGSGPAPRGMDYPACTTTPPQAPHKPMNRTTAPLHFYRIEFRRLDSEDIQSHWKEWYPEATQAAPPVKNLAPGANLGPNFSKEWPYPIVYDGIQAAPNNYKLLFEDQHLRFVEVLIRPGETTPIHGDPYPSVLAIGSISGDPSSVTYTMLDPSSPLNGQDSGHGPAPTVMNMKVPLCETQTARAPYAIHNGGSVPLHYYQFDFKRIDGAEFVTNWQKWYPWMMYMKYMR